MSAIPAGYKQTEVGVIPKDWGAPAFRTVVSLYIDYRGRTPRKLGMDWGGGEILALSANNVQMGEIDIEREAYYGGDDLYRKWMTQGDCERGDVLITMEAPLGNVAQIPDDNRYILSQRVLLIKPKSVLSRNFLAHLMRGSYFQGQLVANSSGSTALGIQRARLDEIPIAIPSLPEQRAIADALSDVDALLAKLDQLIAKRRDLKQAAMQQLLTGQTRLPGFSGAWEVKRLGDVGKCLRGVSYRGDADLSVHDTNNTKRLLRSNNVQNATIVTSDLQFVNSERVSENQLLQDKDILICMANGSKALVGKAGYFNVRDGYEYTFGAFMGCFRSNSANADARFVFYQFQTEGYRNHINNLLAGSSINNLTPGSIESLEFSMPLLPEQTAIATALADMDAELATLEARRDKTRALKQGMMQELLTGRIRLV